MHVYNIIGIHAFYGLHEYCGLRLKVKIPFPITPVTIVAGWRGGYYSFQTRNRFMYRRSKIIVTRRYSDDFACAVAEKLFLLVHNKLCENVSRLFPFLGFVSYINHLAAQRIIMTLNFYATRTDKHYVFNIYQFLREQNASRVLTPRIRNDLQYFTLIGVNRNLTDVHQSIILGIK